MQNLPRKTSGTRININSLQNQIISCSFLHIKKRYHPLTSAFVWRERVQLQKGWITPTHTLFPMVPLFCIMTQFVSLRACNTWAGSVQHTYTDLDVSRDLTRTCPPSLPRPLTICPPDSSARHSLTCRLPSNRIEQNSERRVQEIDFHSFSLF